MSLKAVLTATALAVAPMTAFAGDITVSDPYARASTPAAKTGAAFMSINNTSGADDRLVAVNSGAADLVQLHTHETTGDGIMRMIHVEQGFPIKAGETLSLARGGNHVMLMGLTSPLMQGDMISVTLSFETAGDVVVEVPVDLERMPDYGAGGHGHKMQTN